MLPANTSAAAPTDVADDALSLALTGTDARSGVDHAEWRVDGGDVQTGSTAAVATEGIQTLETRIVDRAGNASAWRSESVRIDRTKPVNTTPRRDRAVAQDELHDDGHRHRREPRLGRGPRSSTSSTTARSSRRPAVSITTAGPHTLETRVVDIAGNVSDWRDGHDRHRQDRSRR